MHILQKGENLYRKGRHEIHSPQLTYLVTILQCMYDYDKVPLRPA